jgi:hypothetical protein
LKNPENNMIGNMIIGTTEETDFASNITLPNNKPNDAPLNDIKKNTKQCIKNCPPLFAKSTIK